MYQRVLLTLDGPALAEQALPHAVAQAERFQAELILLRVLEPVAKNLNLPIEAVRRAKEVTRELAREYLERVAVGVRESGIPVRAISFEGDAHKETVHFAEGERVDLIVMCTRGHAGLSRWLMGSVGDRVVRGASVPMLPVSMRQEKIERIQSIPKQGVIN